MKLLPYDAFTLQSSDALAIAVEKLAAQVEPPKVWHWYSSHHHAPYAGSVSEDGFKIHRIIHYRNSFLPVIRGRFIPSGRGTEIQITMQLHPAVIAFLCIWYLGWYSALLPVTLLGGIPLELAFVFLGMPAVLAVAFWWAFWYEAHRSRRELTEIFSG